MRRVYKNTALNIGAQVFVLLVMFFSMPWIVKGLGEVGFAILSLAWTVITYFSLWDLGIGRAVTKFVAAKRAAGKMEQVVSVIYIGSAIGIIMGVLFGVLIFMFSPQIGRSLFKVPLGFHATILSSLRIVACSMPILLLQSVFRGVVMGFDRFDMSNLIQMINAFLQWGGALVLVLARFNVLWIIGFVMITRMITTIVLAGMISRIINWKHFKATLEMSLLMEILSFGGWAMVSQAVSPVVQYGERFVLSAVLATSIVTYYVVPYEVASKMLILAVGLVTALFPVISRLNESGSPEKALRDLYREGERLLVFFFLPLGAFLVSFAPDILGFWMGRQFASIGTATFRILIVAFVFSSISQLPFTTLQGVGRTDLTGKYHLVELPAYLLFTFWAVHSLGLIGAALATLVRTSFDLTCMYALASSKLGLKVSLLSDILKTLIFPLLSLSVGIGIAFAFDRNLVVKILSMIATLTIYSWVVYLFSFQESEREVVKRLLDWKRWGHPEGVSIHD